MSSENIINDIEERIKEIESATVSLKETVAFLYKQNYVLVKKLKECEDD